MAIGINHKVLLALAIVATASAAPFGPSLQAANTNGNWTGAGANANWTTLNWSSASAPGSTAAITGTNADSSVATFNAAIANTWGNASGNPIVIDSANENIKGINFTTSAGNYFIGSTEGNPLYLSSGGVIQILVALSAANAIETINAPLVVEGNGGTYTLTNLSANGTGAGAGTLNFGGSITGGASGTTTLNLAGNSTNANTISGQINNGLATTLNLVKGGGVGASGGVGLSLGTWVLTANNGYTGTTTVNVGTLSVAGVSGAITSSSGITVGGMLYSQSTNSKNGATLLLDNSVVNNNDRIAGDVKLTLAGELSLSGNGTSGSTTESINNLEIDTGATIVTVGNTGAGQIQTLAAATFTRSNNATALVRGESLGNGTANSTGVTIGSGLTQVGTATSSSGVSTGTTTNLKIVPYLIGDTSATGIGGNSTGNFVTYDATSGLRVLGSSEQLVLGTSAATNSTNIGGNTDLNVRVNAGIAANLTGAQLFNSLALARDASTGIVTSLTGDGSVLTISSGALLDGGSGSEANSLSGFSSITFGNGEAVITRVNGGAQGLTINSPIDVTGGGGLTKGGAGNLILTADNLYTGGTIINQGTITVGNGTGGNRLASTGAATVNPQGELVLNMADGGVFDNAIVLTDSGITGNNGFTGFGSVVKNAVASVNTLSGAISGAGGITVSNSVADDVLSLSGTTKTYQGPTNIQNGILRVVGDVLSTSSVLRWIPNSSSANPTLQLRWDDNLTFHNGGVTFASAGTQVRIGTIDVGPITNGIVGKTLTIEGTFTMTGLGHPANPTQLNITGAAGYTLGIQTFNPQATSAGDPLQVNVSGPALSIGAVTIPSTMSIVFNGPGNSEITGNSTLNTATQILTVSQSGSGVLSLSGSAIAPAGNGGFAFVLSNGTLNVNSDTALGSSATGTYARSILISGGTLDNSSVAAHTATANPTVTIDNNFAFGGTRALSLGTGNTSLGDANGAAAVRVITTNGTTEALMLGGVITAGTATGLTKGGAGTLVLSGASPTFVLPVLVTGGTLTVGGSVGSAIRVNAGTLGGSGSAAGGVTIGDGSGSADAILSPGNSPGTFTTAGALSFASDGAYKYELDSTSGASDTVAANGVTIDAAAVFNFNESGDESFLATDPVFTVIDNTGGTAISGVFANLADGSSFTNGAYTFTANYSGGTGNDLTLTAAPVSVPEPASVGILGLGVMGLLMRRRRGV